VAAGIITSATCSFWLALQHLLGIMGGAVAWWGLGGLAAMGLATLSPDFYRHAFIGVPEEPAEMLRYTWSGVRSWVPSLAAWFRSYLGS
jgi:hypothetical protein